MINQFKNKLSYYLNSKRDWKTKEKILVIESDDWGSIRMPNKEIFDKLNTIGYDLKLRPFERFDSILTNDDLTSLFGLLLKFKDINGNSPVITANVITANPDFNKIKDANYQEYFYESFRDTLINYDVDFNLWRNAINDSILHPQFHGREHLNVENWMSSLSRSNSEERIVFDYGLMGIPPKMNLNLGNLHQIAFNLNTNKNIDFLRTSIEEGVKIFKNNFSFNPSSFIAPAYTWDNNIEKILMDNGIKIIQGGRYQLLPLNKGKTKHYIGENKNGLIYNVRNAYFEPSTILDFNKRESSLNHLKNSTKIIFENNNPLVLSMHRLNFSGRIDIKNRDNNLKLLNQYFIWLLSEYPNIKFLNTKELINLINNENSNT